MTADLARRAARPAPPRIRVECTDEGVVNVQAALGRDLAALVPGAHVEGAGAVLRLLLAAAGRDEGDTNNLLALVAGLEPRDLHEALLAVLASVTSTISVRAAAGAVAGGRVDPDLARCAATCARTAADVLGRLDARRRPAGVQTIRVERIEAQQVAVGCAGGGGPGEGSPK